MEFISSFHNINVIGKNGKPYQIRLRDKKGIKIRLFNLDNKIDGKLSTPYHHGIFKSRDGIMFYIFSDLLFTENKAREISEIECIELLTKNSKLHKLKDRKFKKLRKLVQKHD